MSVQLGWALQYSDGCTDFLSFIKKVVRYDFSLHKTYHVSCRQEADIEK